MSLLHLHEETPEMAVALIGGQAFAALYDAVILACRKNSRFKVELKLLQSTLEALKRRTLFIQLTGEYNMMVDLGNDEVEEFETQMVEGTKLVTRLPYNSRCYLFISQIYGQFLRLVELEASLKRLLDSLSLPAHRNISQTFSLLRRNRDRFHKLQRTVEESELVLYAILQITNEAAGINTESMEPPEGCNGRVNKQVLLSPSLGKIFEELSDVVIEAKEKRLISDLLLEGIKFLLEYQKPLIKDIELLDCPHEELEQFRMQMKKGTKLLKRSMKVCLWTSFKKHQFTSKLVRLDESLREQLYILLVQLARKANEVLDSTTAMEATFKQIEKSTLKLQRNS